MYPETLPIVINAPKDFKELVIHPVHDMHFGNECFSMQKWNAVKSEILSEPNHYVIWIGDLMENAIPNSKGEPLTQMYSPQEQKDFVVEQFRALKDRTIAIVDGNHEYNRVSRNVGMYPLYDCAAIAGIEDKYRTAYAVIDISFGGGRNRALKRPYEYVILATHQTSDLKKFGFADALEGFDCLLSGHDHEPKDRPRMKLVYVRQNKAVTFKSVESINCGSFLNYGGYGARGSYRPLSDKTYKIVLSATGKTGSIQTIGYYPTAE